MSGRDAILVASLVLGALAAACWWGEAPKVAAFFATLAFVGGTVGYVWEQFGSPNDLDDDHWRRR